MSPESKRDQYLRGLASSIPPVTINASKTRHEILQIAFDAVANRADWKAPIHAVVTIHQYDPIGLDIYEQAIEYFTGTKPNLYIVDGFNKDTGKATYRIVSEGYRLGPAGG
jgi:hypothetical protein